MLPSTAAPDVPKASNEETREHLRGANLLLVGRVLSVGVNLLVNVLIVRYLSKGDYGAFAYGLAMGAVGANLLLLGMPRAVGRFGPLYQERGEYGAMFGSLVASTALVAGVGVLGLAAVYAFDAHLSGWIADPLVLQLTLLLIVLAPLDALDRLFQSMLAAFAGARALFLRRHVLGPLLRLCAVLLVMALSGGVRTLAWAYLGASLLGIALYGPMLVRALDRAGLLEHLRLSELRFRWRELLGYGVPLVAADVMVAVRAPIAIVLLEAVRDTGEIADLNAFLKIAGLNLIVLQSVKQLFLPLASRMLAREDHGSLDDVYWQTTIWVALLTFPFFLACIVMPDTVALLVYGREYVDSSAVLTVLALGTFLNAALGLNTYTLNVYARVRFVAWSTALATLGGTLAAWLLVPEHGAWGAAVGLTVALVLQNALHHWGLQALTRVELLQRKYLRVYATEAAAVLSLLTFDHLVDPPALVEGALVVLVSTALLRLHRETMDLAGVLPELGRLPLLGRLLLSPGAAGRAVAKGGTSR